MEKETEAQRGHDSFKVAEQARGRDRLQISRIPTWCCLQDAGGHLKPDGKQRCKVTVLVLLGVGLCHIPGDCIIDGYLVHGFGSLDMVHLARHRACTHRLMRHENNLGELLTSLEPVGFKDHIEGQLSLATSSSLPSYSSF